MSLKNLIVKGRYFVAFSSEPGLDKQRELYHTVRANIQEYLLAKGYEEHGNNTVFRTFANMEFYIRISNALQKPKKRILLRRAKEPYNPHLEQLSIMKNAAPWHISVCCHPDTINKKEIISIDVTSEPAIIHKYQQLNYRPILNQDDIDLIVYENEEFISRFAEANLLNVLEKPHPLGSFIKTPVTEKLRFFDFSDIAVLLEKGRQDLERGKSEDGLVDLRSALELFFVKIVERKGGKPAPQKDVKNNIDKLFGLGYIDQYTRQLLLKLAHTGLYVTLSNVTHDRVTRDYFDARFQFNVAEEIFDYVIERSVKMNIHT
jgi:hypothetical protein